MPEAWAWRKAAKSSVEILKSGFSSVPSMSEATRRTGFGLEPLGFGLRLSGFGKKVSFTLHSYTSLRVGMAEARQPKLEAQLLRRRLADGLD